jgi:hypothetical protein
MFPVENEWELRHIKLPSPCSPNNGCKEHAMKFDPRIIYSTTLAVAVLGGCNTPPERQQEQAGVVIGAVVGGLLGSEIGHGSGRTAATIVGMMVGRLSAEM